MVQIETHKESSTWKCSAYSHRTTIALPYDSKQQTLGPGKHLICMFVFRLEEQQSI